MTIVDFFNSCIGCYRLFIEWLFTYAVSGIPVGYIFLACIVFGIIVRFVLGGVK